MFSGAERKPLLAVIIILSALLTALPYAAVLINNGNNIVGIPEREPAMEGDSDAYHHVWQFWWVSRALGRGEDPRQCSLIYAPEGASLVYDHVGWTDTFLFALTGASPEISHTLSLFLGTLLTAIFGFLLARSWGADALGSLFAALAMAWLPSRTAHLLQHYQLANIWTLPGALWAARLYSRDGGGGKAVLLFLLCTAGAFQTPFIAIFLLPALAVTAAMGRCRRGRTAGMLLIWLASVSLFALFTYSGAEQGISAEVNWREAIYWSAEPQSMLLPSPFGLVPAMAGMPLRMSWMPNTAEGVITGGLVLTAVFVFLAARGKRWKLPLTAAVLAILALGPCLRIFGRPLGIPLPFRILQFMPVLGGIRAPSRFIIPAGILMAAASGVWITAAGRKWKFLALGLLALETAPLSLPSLSPDLPGELEEIPPGSTVIELPVNRNVRLFSWFQSRCGYSRSYSFLARQPVNFSRSPEGRVLVYHRWLYPQEDREQLDRKMSRFFQDPDPEDSVWTAIGPDPL